jgi:hypothetical protein
MYSSSPVSMFLIWASRAEVSIGTAKVMEEVKETRKSRLVMNRILVVRLWFGFREELVCECVKMEGSGW